jgi:hypothetical protein
MVVAKTARPFRISYAESKDISIIKREKAAAELENQQLKREKQALLTASGKEIEARKQGWVKDGEVVGVVGQPEQTAAPEYDQPKPDAPKSKWQAVKEKLLSKFGRKPSP